MSPEVADIVAKRFWVFDEATLIQDQPAIRKVDSKICSLRFDSCAQATPRRLLQQYRPDPEVPTAGPAGPLIEVDLPCRRNEWHGSF
jgi:hypothetical protein